MDKEFVTGGDQEDSDGNEERIIPSAEESASEAEFKQRKWFDSRNVMGRSFCLFIYLKRFSEKWTDKKKTVKSNLLTSEVDELPTCKYL